MAILSNCRKGVFHPSQFKKNPKTGVYEAHYTLNGAHTAAAFNMPQSQVFNAKDGITAIHGGKLWGGGVMTAMSVGTSDTDGSFKPFSAIGGSAAVLAESGHVIRGHFAGNDDGLIHPTDIHLDTSNGPWVDEDAANSLSKYNKTAAEIASETFDTFPKVEVDGNTYGLINPEASVASIIERYKNDRHFYDGVYSKGHHIVDGKMLVSEQHYNELHTPLRETMEKTESPLRIMVRAGQSPTEKVYYQMKLMHGAPKTSSTSGDHVASQVNEEREKAVRTALHKMKMAPASAAELKFVEPTAGGGAAVEEVYGEDA